MGGTAAATPLRRGRKFDQVLAGAREVFLRDGFEGALVDEIARQAGVSKATLYSYFPDKRELFLAVVRNECEAQAQRATAVIDESQPPEIVLRKAAEQIVGFVVSRFALRIFRICLAEADRFPELGQAFYSSGPMLGRSRLSSYMQKAAARGQLVIDDYELAADQYAELCKANIWNRAAFGVQSSFSQDEMERTINGAVAVFMACYGAAGHAAGAGTAHPDTSAV